MGWGRGLEENYYFHMSDTTLPRIEPAASGTGTRPTKLSRHLQRTCPSLAVIISFGGGVSASEVTKRDVVVFPSEVSFKVLV